MRIVRFFGKSAREGLARLRKRIGPHALVLATRPVTGGIEIIAAEPEAAAAAPRRPLPPFAPAADSRRLPLEEIEQRIADLSQPDSAAEPRVRELAQQMRQQAAPAASGQG